MPAEMGRLRRSCESGEPIVIESDVRPADLMCGDDPGALAVRLRLEGSSDVSLLYEKETVARVAGDPANGGDRRFTVTQAISRYYLRPSDASVLAPMSFKWMGRLCSAALKLRVVWKLRMRAGECVTEQHDYVPFVVDGRNTGAAIVYTYLECDVLSVSVEDGETGEVLSIR